MCVLVYVCVCVYVCIIGYNPYTSPFIFWFLLLYYTHSRVSAKVLFCIKLLSLIRNAFFSLNGFNIVIQGFIPKTFNNIQYICPSKNMYYFLNHQTQGQYHWGNFTGLSKIKCIKLFCCSYLRTYFKN